MKINKSIEMFLVAAAAILLWFLIQNIEYVASLIQKISAVLSPFIYAFAIAYILNYPYKWFLGRFNKIKFKKPIKEGAKKAISVLLTYLLFIILAGTFFYTVVPQIVNAITSLVDTIPHYVETLVTNVEIWMLGYFSRYNFSSEDITKILTTVGNDLSTNFNLQDFMKNIVNVLLSMTVGIKNFLLGIIISIYFLVDKERFIITSKKFVYAISSKQKADRIVEVLRLTDKTFGGFIIAKVVDSMIVGVLCYIGMMLLRLDYAVVISVLIGVCNIIPFFGPFIGAIPSVILLLLVSPWQALVFVIFIIILQQFDGNFLDPKLSGESTGIRAIYVVFAVIVGGGLFGILGMFVGVPFFAVAYALISEYINKKLSTKNIIIDK